MHLFQAATSFLLLAGSAAAVTVSNGTSNSTGRENISINNGWRFERFEYNPDGLIYDFRPDNANLTNVTVLKPWILPSGNDFLANLSNAYQRPSGDPGSDVPYVQATYDDSAWEQVDLPHDWAIQGPFYTGNNPIVPATMGRLPVQGIGWYRQKLDFTTEDLAKSVYLDIEGAQSYAMVWLNGHLVGGWPYGYNSFRLDLTPYLKTGSNQLSIRIDNPNNSSRWYPGAGLYRNVWLVKASTTHVAQWGTTITSRDVSIDSATIDIIVEIENKSNATSKVDVVTDIYSYDSSDQAGALITSFDSCSVPAQAGQKTSINSSVTLQQPQLWSPATPNRYLAITRVSVNGQVMDTYNSTFGVRAITYDPDNGLLVNGERVEVKGTDQHHDLGAIGAAFVYRAAERHLEILQDLGSNAIRMSHNPPAPGLLDLTDKMGFIVLDEIFDCWQLNKTANDFHLIFNDWHEQDLRSMIRRDKNHPSIVAWSFGNEVGEQQTGAAGTALAQQLHDIVHSEDALRLATAAQNSALPNYTFSGVVDITSLNYQGAGIRDTNAYSGISGIRTQPQYPFYHATFPTHMIWSSESASALSTRGTYIFPVVNETSAPANATSGEDGVAQTVSAYELYSATFGSSADKVFLSQDLNPYVAGEFVWTGWDYLGEPTPFNDRSSYSGIIDLAGFPKDRWYLYQARWRPDLKMAYVLPHWNWEGREGLDTPVHVFTAGDEAELFVNGVSQGRQRRGEYQYRFRWDEVVYQPGTVEVVTYKEGVVWANASRVTTGPAAGIRLTADRSAIAGDARDLSFITAEVVDANGVVVPTANNTITFDVSAPGALVATDNGYPADLVAFPSPQRQAFSGLALAIIRGQAGSTGAVTITANAEGLAAGTTTVTLQ